MALQLSQLTKTFRADGREVHALDAVSLQVEPGEFVAVQGRSGCGKSTLLLIAGGLLAPDRGSVRIDDVDPYALSAEARSQWRAARIGFVFQQFHLVPYLSVLDNVTTPSLAVKIPNVQARAKELLERFGLTDRSHHVPSQLSTGERQRTALARALLASPQLILADEPTGNLDRENADSVLESLAEFSRGGGAVLMVTHDPSAVARADRTLTLQAGRLVTVAETSQTR